MIVASFTRAVNIMMADFGQLPACILSRLFYNFCCSFYGVALCNLNAPHIQQLYVAWRKAVRKVLKLDCRARSIMLPLMLCKMPIHCTLTIRVVRFFCSMLTGKNEVTKSLASRCLYQV